jgi:metal-sulfur cluster biosynthetic enzyme
MSAINNLILEAQVLDALRTCYDPEIPVNIYEL